MSVHILNVANNLPRFNPQVKDRVGVTEMFY